MPTVQIPNKFQPLFEKSRYKVFYGGRGAAKSWSFAIVLIILALQSKLRILCAREIQNSIKDSVHRLLQDQIEKMGFSEYFDTTDNIIRCTSGSEIIFSGLHMNIGSIKSKEGIDIVWVEEAESVSAFSWKTLIPTIRKPGSEIWVTFNPRYAADPTYNRFVTHEPPESTVVKVGWQDNPWFPDVLKAEKDHLYKTNPEEADHVWGGGLETISEAQILHGKWCVDFFEPQEDWFGPYLGADWGFSADPTTLIKSWVSGAQESLKRELWIEREAWGLRVDNDRLPALFDKVPRARAYVIRADNARPETISHMNSHGYPNVIATKKWPGSIEDGISHLRGYSKITIHPRCVHTKEEATLYSHKIDKKTGDVLPDIVDKNNHCIDAIRYALTPLTKHKSTNIDPEVGMLDIANPWARRR